MQEFGSIERASKNTPIQGSSADMTKLALIYIHREIEENWSDSVKIVMTVHDQIDTICKEEVADAWSIKMTELMEKAAKNLDFIEAAGYRDQMKGLQKLEKQFK